MMMIANLCQTVSNSSIARLNTPETWHTGREEWEGVCFGETGNVVAPVYLFFLDEPKKRWKSDLGKGSEWRASRKKWSKKAVHFLSGFRMWFGVFESFYCRYVIHERKNKRRQL